MHPHPHPHSLLDDDVWTDEKPNPSLSAEAAVFMPPSLFMVADGEDGYYEDDDGFVEGDYYEGDVFGDEDQYDGYEPDGGHEDDYVYGGYYGDEQHEDQGYSSSYAHIASSAPAGHVMRPGARGPVGNHQDGFVLPMSDGRRLCPFFLQGSCKYGLQCKDSHDMGTHCALCRQHFCMPQEASAETSAAHMEVCPEMQMVLREKEWSSRHVCQLCGQNPLERNDRYGILISCTHPFCLFCIKEYRRTENGHEKDSSRRCPVCKEVSHYVIPCDRFIDDPDRKEKLITQFQQSLATIPCAKFSRGLGSCPFGSSCFYAHIDEEGNNAELPRIVTSSASESKVLTDEKLSDMIDWQGARKLKTKKKK
jgi:hypothetical protein